ncbi:MAG: Gfo/Idh/MocA family oxidoreductase [Myxococcales bacterium]|nr:Gfo/Idh/MocA family oxidoreductase [Myxococcales bacterium]
MQSKPVRIGLVGCGRITDLHVRAYAKDDRAILAALCDTDPEMLAKRSQEWGVSKTYTDYQSLLDDPEIDAVEICTPTRLHFDMVQKAAKAKKHISVQKPVTLAIDEAFKLRDVCKKAGVVFKICENYVFHPTIQLARQMIEAGEIGTPLNLSCRVVAGSGGWHIASDAWKWRLEDAKVAGGTQTFDHGHHIFSTAWYLLGEIEKIHGWIHSVDGVVDAPSSFHWTYANGLTQGSAIFTVSTDMPVDAPYYSNDEWFEITGTRGILWINRCTSNIRTDLAPMTLFRDGKVQQIDGMPTDWQEGFTGALRNFVDAILGKAAPTLDGNEGIEILAYALAAQRSAKLERPVLIEEIRQKKGEVHYQSKRLRSLLSRLQPPDWLTRLWTPPVDASACRDLTDAMPQRFQADAVKGWDATILLDIQGPHGGQWTATIQNDTLDFKQGKHGQPGVTLHCSDVYWTAILQGKKSVEAAFFQGQLKLEGKSEWALSLKKAFQL